MIGSCANIFTMLCEKEILHKYLVNSTKNVQNDLTLLMFKSAFIGV